NIPKEFWNHPDFGKLPSTTACDNCFEEIHKRTSNQRFYRDIEDTAVSYNEVSYNFSNYLKDGNWKAIETKLKKTDQYVYAALSQPFPTELNVQKKHTAITIEGVKFLFNNIEFIEERLNGETIVVAPDWTDMTVGEDGAYITNVYPDIDLVLRFGNGFVKSEFIIKKPITQISKLIIKDKII